MAAYVFVPEWVKEEKIIYANPTLLLPQMA
jgi:hypothetical protein